MVTAKVNNLPEYASDYKYIACKVIDNKLWFYGAFNEYEKALKAAREVFGVVVENEVEG